jgi:aflatoxin B1 aldehyde reductase
LWGHPGTQSRIHDEGTAQKFIDVMLTQNYIGIDTGQNYGDGTSEKVSSVALESIILVNKYLLQMIGTLALRGRARIDTKIFPLKPGDHSASRLKESIQKSLKDLGPNKIRVFYLHNPDHATPFEETLEAVNDLYESGLLYVRLVYADCPL